MNSPIYIISDRFDYSKLICADAGPQYAFSMGWDYSKLNAIKEFLDSDYHLIIDPRLFEDEYERIYQLILQHPRTSFIPVVTDPCFEECIDKPLYQFLFRTTTFANVRYLTQYQPAEIVAFLRNIKGARNMAVVNFPYAKNKEIPNPFEGRKKSILFSGSINSQMYPERYNFWRKYTRSLWRFKIDTLKHPGYPAPGEEFKHNIVGSTYIQHLSAYQFMFVSGSRCNAELMKYSECAYAGCVPVGLVPSTFNNQLRKYFVPIDLKRFNKSLVKIFSIPQKELVEIASGYRNEFASQRNPSVLNQKLQVFLRTT